MYQVNFQVNRVNNDNSKIEHLLADTNMVADIFAHPYTKM